MAEKDKNYFVFSDGKRYLEFNCMPQGARNSGSTMSLLMELVFRGIPPEFLCIYLDDVLLATPTVETHLMLLAKVFIALKSIRKSVCWLRVRSGL